jgi:hypothetical protein
VTAHPTSALREILAEHSFLKRAAEAGARVQTGGRGRGPGSLCQCPLGPVLGDGRGP